MKYSKLEFFPTQIYRENSIFLVLIITIIIHTLYGFYSQNYVCLPSKVLSNPKNDFDLVEGLETMTRILVKTATNKKRLRI